MNPYRVGLVVGRVLATFGRSMPRAGMERALRRFILIPALNRVCKAPRPSLQWVGCPTSRELERTRRGSAPLRARDPRQPYDKVKPISQNPAHRRGAVAASREVSCEEAVARRV